MLMNLADRQFYSASISKEPKANLSLTKSNIKTFNANWNFYDEKES